ncbi:hypothetical protein GCM10017776_20330 [Streptomyces griseoluteus]|nr:hypothetical protein GCM10017776_20330 [Streptomyces griseoluteus]
MTPDSSSRPSWASRNYSLLTGAAVVTSLGANGSLIAAAFAVLDAGGDAGVGRGRVLGGVRAVRDAG